MSFLRSFFSWADVHHVHLQREHWNYSELSVRPCCFRTLVRWVLLNQTTGQDITDRCLQSHYQTMFWFGQPWRDAGWLRILHHVLLFESLHSLQPYFALTDFRDTVHWGTKSLELINPKPVCRLATTGSPTGHRHCPFHTLAPRVWWVVGVMLTSDLKNTSHKAL